MEKPRSLRAAIVAALPEFDRDPDRLQMWVEDGHIKSPMTPDRGFGWDYTLNITITDMTTHPSVIFLAINDWLRTNQPDLLAPESSAGYRFEADILNIGSGLIDLHITLKLTEQVALVTGEDGALALQHVAEPDLTWLTGGTPLTTPPRPLASLIAAPGTTPIPLPFP